MLGIMLSVSLYGTGIIKYKMRFTGKYFGKILRPKTLVDNFSLDVDKFLHIFLGF